MGIGPSTKETSLHHFRDPLLEVVSEDTDLDLLGLIIVGTPDDNKDKMRELIRNERRIELCFENFRFWDLRRWNVDLTKLNETALGVEISKSGSIMSYSPLTVEKRKYEEYMIYGPIPFAEVMKWSNLEQNAGWK